MSSQKSAEVVGTSDCHGTVYVDQFTDGVLDHKSTGGRHSIEPGVKH
ncbi:MAG TPA: hypothetical protein VK564_01285 [Thermodesulfobacteriota bacterium]|nr:hypothetical protein [Thermodesulfobacteriota bacterium]